MDLPRVVLDFPYLSREKAEKIEFKPEKLATMVAEPDEQKFLNMTDELKEVISLAKPRVDLNVVSPYKSNPHNSDRRRSTIPRESYDMRK